jgi:hypothetical protein
MDTFRTIWESDHSLPSCPKESRVSWPVRLLLTAVALLAMSGAAQAATPFTAGSGNEPTIAVGADGTGHVVWNATAGAADQVGYCRVAAGAGACNRSAVLAFPGTGPQETGRPRVFTPAPNKVVVVAGCWQCTDGVNRIQRWVSTDNGTTFVGPDLIGTGFLVNGFGTWLEDLAGGTFVAANGASTRASTQLLPDGAPVAFASAGFTYWPEVTRVHGTDTLVAATNNLSAVQYGVYLGPWLVTDINQAGHWLKNKTLSAPETKNGDTALNSGPSGTYLTYKSAFPGETRIGLRRFSPGGSEFGGPSYVEGGDAIDNSADQPDSAQDASGRVHVAWRSTYSGGRLRYTVSDTAGANFSPAANLAVSENFTDPELAAGGDGRGFATWTQGTTGAVRVVPLDPTPESGGTGTGTDTTRPGVSGARIGDRTLVPGQATTFRFNASEAGMAVLTFEKRFKKGIKVKKKAKGKNAKGKKAKLTCLPSSKKRLRALRKQAKTKKAYRKLLKKRACKGWQRIGQIRQRVQAGANSIPFNGRIAGRKLTKGQYRGRLVITDAAGLASRTETIKFKVVAKKAKKKPVRRR